MELFAPLYDDEGNLAVNEDGTLACRPLTPAEMAELLAALVSHCDYCSGPLPAGSSDLACPACQAKIDDAALALHDEHRRDEADAALDAAQAADPAQRELDDYAADLAYEYSGPEYDAGPETWDTDEW